MNASSNPGDWILGFQNPVPKECPNPVELPVEGEIPAEIRGTLYRIGPAKFDIFGERQTSWFDGDGLCLFAKRLERGRFVWPQAESGAVSLSAAQLAMLMEGIDWRRPARTWQPDIAA